MFLVFVRYTLDPLAKLAYSTHRNDLNNQTKNLICTNYELKGVAYVCK